MNNFSKRLSEALEKSKMTQKELAVRIGVTTATLSRYISGERLPKIDVVANMATALHTTSNYLLSQEDNAEFDFMQVERLLARNAAKMTVKEKKALINALFNEDED